MKGERGSPLYIPREGLMGKKGDPLINKEKNVDEMSERIQLAQSW